MSEDCKKTLDDIDGVVDSKKENHWGSDSSESQVDNAAKPVEKEEATEQTVENPTDDNDGGDDVE